jgi:membrane-bound acyltransferase YfiQ involved in biofilm formation
MSLVRTSGWASERRPHVHELDRLRVETAFSVVVVHVLMFSMFVEHSTLGNQVQSAFVDIFHFTRELFMFVTAFALAYVYFGKPFNWRYFWQRRGIGVLVPYVLWSVIYTIVRNPGRTWQVLVGTSVFNIATGSAQYQLYYILLTLQFYLLLPLFLWFLGRVRRGPWTVLSISFVLQVIELFVDFRFVAGPGAAQTPLINVINGYQLRLVLLYQFYFILGGMAALHVDHVRAFLAKHGRLMLLVGAVAFAANLVVYLFYVYIRHISLGYATSAFQPIMAIYCTGVIAFLGYFACRSVHRSPAGADPHQPRSPWWGLLADASFGIYLIHPLMLMAIQVWVLSRLSNVSPWITMPLACVLTCAASTAATMGLMRIPVLSRTVGRERAARRHSRVSRAIGSTAPDNVEVA